MAIFTAIATAIFGAGFATTIVGAFLIKTIASIATSALVRAIQGRPDQPEQPRFSIRTTMQVGGQVPRSFIVGRTATAGSLVYVNTFEFDAKSPNSRLTMVIALSDLPVAGLNRVMVNGEYVTLDYGGLTSRGWPVLEYRIDGVDYLWIKFYDGTQTTADNYLVNKVSSGKRPWSNTRVGYGVAYAIVSARIKQGLFTGVPRCVFEIDGMDLYDVSKDSSEGGSGSHDWSDPTTWGGAGNDSPVVQAYNIMRGISYNGTWFYGPQTMSGGRLPSSEWIASINKAAALVTTNQGQEPRYRSGAEIPVNLPIGDALAELMTTCSGRIADMGGIYKPHVGEIGAADFTLTDDDLRSNEEETFEPFPEIDDTINGIVASYPEPEEAYQMKAAPPRYDAALEAEDGNRRLAVTVELPFVPYKKQVQRLGKESLAEARRHRRHVVPLPPEFSIYEPNDVCSFTSAIHGYSNKLFRVNSSLDKPNGDVVLDLIEADPADYSWDENTDLLEDTIVPPVSLIPDAQDIGSFAVTASFVSDTNGNTRFPAILIQWDGADLDDVDGLTYEIRLASNATVVQTATITTVSDGQVLVSVGIVGNEDYEVRATFRANSGRAFNWTAWAPVTTLDIVVDPVIQASLQLNAAQITSGKITADFMSIDKLLQLFTDTAALSVNKASSLDYNIDGAYFGRELLGAVAGFVFTTTSINTNNQLEGIRHAENDGLKFYNPKVLVGGDATSGAQQFFASQTIDLSAFGILSALNATFQAGGGGGGAAAAGGPGTTPSDHQAENGGDTVVELYDGDPTSSGVLIATFTATGGRGGYRGNSPSSPSGTTSATDGEASSYGAGGAAGQQGSALLSATNGQDASGTNYGAGGGGGGGQSYDAGAIHYGGEGGRAGQKVTISDYDLSGFTNGAYLVLTLGQGGAGETRSGFKNGGNGAGGLLEINAITAGMYHAGQIATISEKTITDQATVDFTNIPSDDFEDIHFELDDVMPAVDDFLIVRMSSDGGATFISTSTSYRWVFHGYSSTPGTVNGGSNSTSRIKLFSDLADSGALAPVGITGKLDLQSEADATKHTRLHGTLAYTNDANRSVTGTVVGDLKSAGIVNGIRFSCLSGNILSGTIRMRGRRKP